MISVEGLKVEFGIKPLFDDASFVINDKDRIALVGKNGAGKSTMLKILCGLQKPTAGNISIPNDTKIGYLPQVMILQDDTTVREEAQKAFADNTRMKERLDKMNQELAERTDYESESYLASLVDGVCVLNWLRFCCRNQTFCFLTSLLTIWTLRVYNGWNNSWLRALVQWCW